jgi:hypothetical protein
MGRFEINPTLIRDYATPYALLMRLKHGIPKLPTSPLTLFCPFCGAKPKHDCLTTLGGFAAVHVLRVKAAALIDKPKKAVAILKRIEGRGAPR